MVKQLVEAGGNGLVLPIVLFLLFFAGAGVAALFALSAFGGSEPLSAHSVLYGTLATLLGFLAFICLMRDDTLQKAQEVGSEWLGRLNKSADMQVVVEIGQDEIGDSLGNSVIPPSELEFK